MLHIYHRKREQYFNGKTLQEKSNRGFTLTELIISISIILTLLSLITINLSYAHRRSTLNNTLSVFVADVKSQQIKAMLGATEGRTDSDNYGVYLLQNSYVLFHGDTYNSSDTTNSPVSLDNNQEFTTTNKIILFTRVSGEIASFSSASAAISIRDVPSGNIKTLQYNKYGVITTVN